MAVELFLNKCGDDCVYLNFLHVEFHSNLETLAI